MFFEMSCQCSATIQLEVDKNKDEAAWLMANRFATAHVECGFVSPLFEEKPTTTKLFNIPATDKDVT
jgi:hypothetical protein